MGQAPSKSHSLLNLITDEKIWPVIESNGLVSSGQITKILWNHFYKCKAAPWTERLRAIATGGQILNPCTRCPSRTWESNIIPEPSSVKFFNTKEVSPRGDESRHSTTSLFRSQRDPLIPKSHQVYAYDLIHPPSMIIPLIGYSLASAGR